MDKIGMYAVPIIIVFVVVFGAVKKVDLFESFREGAKDGIGSLISVAPSLIGLVIAVNMLSASGFFEIICLQCSGNTAGDTPAGAYTSCFGERFVRRAVVNPRNLWC